MNTEIFFSVKLKSFSKWVRCVIAQVLLARVSYFPLIYDKLNRQFQHSISSSEDDQLWLEYQGKPLKWYVCMCIVYIYIYAGHCHHTQNTTHTRTHIHTHAHTHTHMHTHTYTHMHTHAHACTHTHTHAHTHTHTCTHIHTHNTHTHAHKASQCYHTGIIQLEYTMTWSHHPVYNCGR